MKQKPSFYAIAKGVDPETGEAITNKIVIFPIFFITIPPIYNHSTHN